VAATQATGQLWGAWATSLGRSAAEEVRGAEGLSVGLVLKALAAAAIPSAVLGGVSAWGGGPVIAVLSAVCCAVTAAEIALGEVVTVKKGMVATGGAYALLWLRSAVLMVEVALGMPPLEAFFLACILQEATVLVLFVRMLRQ